MAYMECLGSFYASFGSVLSAAATEGSKLHSSIQ